MMNEKEMAELPVGDRIKKRILNLERYNLAQREFSSSEMESKIRKIIEEEVGK